MLLKNETAQFNRDLTNFQRTKYFGFLEQNPKLGNEVPNLLLALMNVYLQIMRHEWNMDL